MKLAILSYTDGKLYTYSEKFLKENHFDVDWKDEFYSEVEGIESFITTVLGFSIDQIHWMEYTDSVNDTDYIKKKRWHNE